MPTNIPNFIPSCSGSIFNPFARFISASFFNAKYSRYFRFWRALLVPGVRFVLLSVFRNVVNRPRPYEAFELPPVIKKDTKGHSFPSRHVFSATIIAMTFILHSPWSWLGLIFLAIALLLAVVRVVSGVHYISDVVAGIIVAVVAAVLGYIVLY